MRLVAMGALVALSIVSTSAIAQPKYGPGTSATEIKVGQTIAYSGPASAYGQLGKVEDAYFKWLNAKGGINGRKINFISLDDGYSPPKAVENARKLVESDQVAVVFNVLGTPLNTAIRPYMNQKKVPQLFIAAGATDLQRSPAFSLDHGLAAQPAGRGDLLCPASAEEQTRRQGGGALPERRFRQGPAQRPDHGAGRQGQDDDRRRAEFPGDRSHDRQPDDHAQELGRRHPVPVHLCQAGRAGDRQDGRPRLEAA